MTRRNLLLVFAATAVWAIEWGVKGEDPSLERVQRAGRLRVGIDPSYPPFANVDGGGRLDGFDVDLSRELARRLGVQAEFVPLDVGGLFDAVVSRLCDVAVGMPPVREYLKELRYSRGYFNAGQMLVTRKGQATTSGSGLTVGVESGSSADLRSGLLGRRLGGPTFRRATSLEALKAELLAGQLDAILVDAVTGHELVKAERGLALGTGPITREPLVVVVHRYDTRLLQEIDAQLETLEREGFVRGLVAKWLS